MWSCHDHECYATFKFESFCSFTKSIKAHYHDNNLIYSLVIAAGCAHCSPWFRLPSRVPTVPTTWDAWLYYPQLSSQLRTSVLLTPWQAGTHIYQCPWLEARSDAWPAVPGTLPTSACPPCRRSQTDESGQENLCCQPPVTPHSIANVSLSLPPRPPHHNLPRLAHTKYTERSSYLHPGWVLVPSGVVLHSSLMG